MSQIVRTGENRDYIIKNQNVKSIHFNAFLEANANNVDFAVSDFDPSKVFIVCVLKRDGVEHTIFSDSLAATIAGNFYENFDLLHPMNSTINNIVQAKGVAAKMQQILNYELEFGGCINLYGDDQIRVNLQFTQSALVGANLTGSTTCYVDIVEENGTEVENYVPIIKTLTLKAGESKISENLGSGVQRIVYMNLDKGDILAASDPINVLSLNSDVLKFQKVQAQLFGERSSKFQTQAAHEARFHCYEIFRGQDGDHLDGVSLDLLLNPANVAVGKNMIVYYTRIVTAGTIERGQALEQMKTQRLINNHLV